MKIITIIVLREDSSVGVSARGCGCWDGMYFMFFEIKFLLKTKSFQIVLIRKMVKNEIILIQSRLDKFLRLQSFNL